jgi:hypothetical protein
MPARVIQVDETDQAIVGAFSSSRGSFAAVAAGDYADNDVMSNDAGAGLGDPIEFPLAVRAPGGAAKIVGARITYTAATAFPPTSELFLFSQAPTVTEMDDNAAFTAVDVADLPYSLGSILFAAGTDVGPATVSLPSALTPAAPLFVRAAARSIFGILVLRDAATAETAGMLVTIDLYLEN